MKYVLGMYAATPFVALAGDAFETYGWVAAGVSLLIVAGVSVALWLDSRKHADRYLEQDMIRKRMERRAEALRRIEKADRRRKRFCG